MLTADPGVVAQSYPESEALEICVRMRDLEGTDGCLELLAGVAAAIPPAASCSRRASSDIQG